ncbi:MAG: hypothetical protein BAW33_06935 [Desulfobacterales bacterium C00003104]|nr:MAG: hypothetical protein BAW33_06935 [Desulfobacterales bacterium C00003104]
MIRSRFEIGQRRPEAVMHYFVPVPKVDFCLHSVTLLPKIGHSPCKKTGAAAFISRQGDECIFRGKSVRNGDGK